MNFRVDMFRESDGVNVLRVNKSSYADYENLPVDSPCGDKFKLRLSWLNATKQAHCYRINLRYRYLGKRDRVIYTCFKVSSGACGYRILSVPNYTLRAHSIDITVVHNGVIENVYNIPINGR